MTESQLYNNIKTLSKQWVYDKEEIDDLLEDKLESSDISDVIRESETSGLIKNDGTVDTSEYLTSSDMSDYVTKSQTTGLIKNDGTIDTNSYVNVAQGSGSASKNVVTDASGNITVEAKPTIPTKTSDLTNDSGFLTSHQSLTDYIQKSNTAGLVKNDGTIDTNTYLTQHQSLSDIGGEVDVQVKSTANTNAFKTYEITQNNVVVGEIDIPKDFLVKSGSVKTVGSTPSSAETAAGLDVGDLYISLIINTKDSSSSSGNEELIIPANGLVEDTTYDADNSTLQISGTTFSIKSGGVTVTQLANDAVETAKIKDANVTYAKLSSTCIASIKADADSEINAALDALAEAIYPTSS